MITSRQKPRLLVISSVLPFPRNTGQQQRVYYKLQALRQNFHITFLTVVEGARVLEVQEKLLELCDEAIILPARYTGRLGSRIYYKIAGAFFTLVTGLKFSNYLIGEVELTPLRLSALLEERMFSGVLFEYWHAHKVTQFFRERGMYTILDMHDILWRSYTCQLDTKKYLPRWLKRWRIHQYQVREESAWNEFDALIAINQDEHDYAQQRVRTGIKFFYLPMGTDISAWPYDWQPESSPVRIAYYGALGNIQNQHDALLCYREIMPIIWQQFSNVEFWLVGSNPPENIKALASDKRVRVTGFVEQAQDVLKTMSLVFCPWSGTFGFRSRVVEVMALGVPVVASKDAVYGMGFELGNGILLGENSADMASLGLQLLNDRDVLRRQSLLARRQIEDKFTYESTYVEFSNELASFFTH